MSLTPRLYRGLTPAAVQMLRDHDLTADDWIRRFGHDGEWTGDTCGCPDDRCTGNHHDDHEECPCLASLLLDITEG